MKTCIQNKLRGFTLVELMVAMAITTIMVTILISITSISLDTWNRSRSEIRAARQAQAMTEIMARDFEAMVMRPGNNFEWFFAKSGGEVGPTSNRSPNSAEIILFTAATDRYDGKIGIDEEDDKGGDISAVGYSLRFQDPIPKASGDDGDGDFKTFVLFRKLVNPDETFANLLGIKRGENPDVSELQAAFEGMGNIGDRPNFVCENIYQFSLTIHIEAANSNTSITLTQDANSSIQVFGDGMVLDPPNPAISDTGRITAVEISITVLSDNAMTALRGPSTISDEFITKNSFQYSKLIEVPRL